MATPAVWNNLPINIRNKTNFYIYIYYIHTEKYSPKSYVVDFRTQMSSSQSEERTMVFTREKNDTSNQNRERCFFTCEKNDTSNQKPQRCVSFAPKFPPFIAACSAASHTFNEKSFTLRSLVRFLLRQQLVRKYRTPALSMKYSLFIKLLKSV